jgi:hypothetical protein
MPYDVPKLNVLLHGTFAFIDDRGSEILALIPRVSQHVNRAGSWLGETELRGGGNVQYRLHGVKPDRRGQFDRNKNLFVDKKKLANGTTPFVTVILQRPRLITSLRVAEFDRSVFEDATDLISQGQHLHISSLQVFTYDVDDLQELRLEATDDHGGHYWEPVLQVTEKCDPANPFVNLHIISSEDHHGEPFQLKDFSSCIALLGATLIAKPGFAYQQSGIQPNAGLLPPGVNAKETEGLSTRTERMSRLGRLATRTNGDTNQAWYEDDALEDGTETCGGVCGVDL